MRFLLQVSLCCLMAGGVATAQRGGGGGGARGGMGGGYVGGGVGGGNGFRGGFNSGVNLGGNFLHPTSRPHLEFVGESFRGFNNRGFYGGGFYGGGFYSPLYSSYIGYGYPNLAYDYYPYGNGYAGYTEYQPSPNVTVIYPPQEPVAPLSAQRARPVTREYDQYGQEIRPASSSPIYLIALNDHTIRAASSYRVDARTLHYVTLEREEKEVSLDTVDRALSMQLNRERNVAFQLPPQ